MNLSRRLNADCWGKVTFCLLVYPFHFLSRLIRRPYTTQKALCTKHSGTGCVYGGDAQCQCLCEIPTPHTGIRKENKRYTVNLILQSDPSITAEVAWTPICLVLPGDHIGTAMPEIRFDLHGHHHLTVAAVCPSPLSLSICA